jgi:hypothetical protein
MRELAHFPHPIMRITVTSWNGKYALRFEADQYEQVFKIPEEQVAEGIPLLESWARTLQEAVLLRFVAMRKEWTEIKK